MTLQPAHPDERDLFYSLPGDPEWDSSCVGHLRMDFGYKGKEFWSSWWPHNEDSLNTPEFKTNFQQFVDSLRKGGCLKDFKAMQDWCLQYPEAREPESPYTYLFRAEADNYLYCIRCCLINGDYNAYLYCYDKEQHEQYHHLTMYN